uniref:Uncharacterized protein n=1 Tax=Petromyzon marinus TaxID=7757 RepID=S4RGG3_PETMA
MQDFLTASSNILNITLKKSWDQIAKEGLSDSSSLLRSIERYATFFSTNSSIRKSNIMLKGNVLNINTRNPIPFTFENSSVLVSYQGINTAGPVSINSILFTSLSQILPMRIGMSLPCNNPYNINSFIMAIVDNAQGNKSIVLNMSTLYAPDETEPTCAFWDYNIATAKGTGGWNTNGCTMLESTASFTICECGHLTSFSTLFSSKDTCSNTLSIITYVCIGISIISLIIAIFLEALVWKIIKSDLTKYARHIVLVNVCVSLLCADVWFIIASAKARKQNTMLCHAAVFIAHFFYLALFFLTLCKAIGLFCSVHFIFPIMKKRHVKRFLVLVGYGCPLAVAIVTIAVTYPRGYVSENACWLQWYNSRALLAFVVPALTIIGINMLIGLVVLFKLLRNGPVTRVNGSGTTGNIIRILKTITVLPFILGLTWGIGIFTLDKKSPIAFHYIFSVLNALQGLFILIIEVLWNDKV